MKKGMIVIMFIDHQFVVGVKLGFILQILQIECVKKYGLFFTAAVKITII